MRNDTDESNTGSTGMFKQITTELDEILSDEDDGGTLFCLIAAYLYSIPIWKLCAFYVYTFTYLRDWGQGVSYRSYLKYVRFPYKLRYTLFVIRVKRHVTHLVRNLGD